MALTLDSTLQARLDTIERQPEIELLSGSFTTAVPFQGNSFGIAGSSTFRPQLLSHSTGRLGQMYIDSSGMLQWMYTDTTRNQWTGVDLSSFVSATGQDTVSDVTVVELANGNIGVVAITYHFGDYKLYGGVISATGTVVTALALIENLSDTYEWRAPYVALLSNGTYYLVYVREEPDTAWGIYARTATTWGTWGADSDITPSGVNTAREIDNTSLFETADGDLFLLFDHVTAVQDDASIYNIFSSISTNYGSSWSAASSRTSYTEYGTIGLDPIMVQKSNGTVWLIFYENVNVLHMDSTATGYIAGCDMDWGFSVKDLHVDSNNGKVIVAYGNSQIGDKSLCGVAVVDIDTWSIDKIYHTGSTPALNSVFPNNHIWKNTHMHGDDNYWVASTTDTTWSGKNKGKTVIAVLDHTADTFTHYVLGDTSMDYYGYQDGLPQYSLPENITYDSNANYGIIGIHVQTVRLDSDRQRLYIGWDGGYYRQYMMFSYIDLTETPDGEGMYSMTWVTDETSGTSIPNQNRTWYEYTWSFEIDKERNYFICYTSGGGNVGFTSWNGGVAVLSEDAGGAIVKYYTPIENNSMALWGPHRGIIYDGCLYGDFYYASDFPYTDQRGLMKVNYLTDAITYYRPSYVTTDQYFFYDFALDTANEYIYMGTAYGIARFSINSGAWTVFNSDTLEGFVRSGEEDLMPFVGYDAVNGNIIGGSWNEWGSDLLEGILMFNENGAYHQLKYINGDNIGTWSWASQEDLSYYTNERNPTAAIDPDDTLWVTWSHVDWEQSQHVLYWDNDGGAVDVIDDLVGPVTLHWRLKNINRLDFTLANGQLYDPQNLLSTKSIVGHKGRRITVRIGENIGGYTYWVNQGTYIVDMVNMDYSRGRMPVLRVNCTGRTALWKDQQVPVSTLYSGAMPDDLIIDLLDDRTTFTSDEYDIPVFNNEHSIYYQWVDKTLWDMIEELADHFFYAMYEDVDGVFTLREVSLTQAVDHEYTDSTQLLNFGPDDTFSDYTNQVRVIGESNDYTEVLHNEELIASNGGTVGWWAKKFDEKIYFSEDGSRQCRNARLVIIHSPKEYGLLLDQLATGDGGIELSYVDPFEKYVVVEIQAKDLTAAFVGAVVAFVAVGAASLWCGASLYSTCGGYIWAAAIAAALVFYILAAVAQYQYEIWARPLGRVKNTIQYEANDLEFQRELNGEVVTQQITDALCYTVAECKRVAEGELAMVRAQRSRLAFKKLTHLQDELLDKIKVYHVYSSEAMEVLVVSLKRTYEKGKGVFDDIEGWRYIP